MDHLRLVTTVKLPHTTEKVVVPSAVEVTVMPSAAVRSATGLPFTVISAALAGIVKLPVVFAGSEKV